MDRHCTADVASIKSNVAKVDVAKADVAKPDVASLFGVQSYDSRQGRTPFTAQAGSWVPKTKARAPCSVTLERLSRLSAPPSHTNANDQILNPARPTPLSLPKPCPSHFSAHHFARAPCRSLSTRGTSWRLMVMVATLRRSRATGILSSGRRTRIRTLAKATVRTGLLIGREWVVQCGRRAPSPGNQNLKSGKMPTRTDLQQDF